MFFILKRKKNKNKEEDGSWMENRQQGRYVFNKK
jgi:hypothetical protein